MKLYKVNLAALLHVVAPDKETAVIVAKGIVVRNPVMLFSSDSAVSIYPKADGEDSVPFVEPADLDPVPEAPFKVGYASSYPDVESKTMQVLNELRQPTKAPHVQEEF